jgi:hypothetical protein
MVTETVLEVEGESVVSPP